MSPVAIVQNGYAIFGVGKDLDEAIEDAKDWTENADLIGLPNHSNTDGEFYWTYCTSKLVEAVGEYGGDIEIDELPDGTLCLPEEIT